MVKGRLVAPEVIRAIVNKHKFRFRKSLGQNFLINQKVLEKISEAAGMTGEDLVVEIGPGIGALTQYLAEKAGQVIAVELDRSLLPILAETLADYPGVQVVHGDALKVDLDQLVREYGGSQWGPEGLKYKVVANLPYYITTPIVMRLLEEGFALQTMVLMVQKEVARRMVAAPGTKDYGALSLAIQYYTQPEIVTYVPPGSFMPPPAVDSAVIKLELRCEPPVELVSVETFFRTIKGAFGQRRKTLLNALSNAKLGLSKEELADLLNRLGIDPNRRGETLSLQEFAALANLVEGHKLQREEYL
ncbi:MAG: 16S rRNA (adenine(1518)-N(6)/adenine(1519)-N(6))-dimethyltransferase RsmA [Clostridia bacterium]|nr:16S rRNA (adenine(1518)-N(6)/adenine(1519)-N(6))-dimethyltransferase RsmA [Clostridia bacterium]